MSGLHLILRRAGALYALPASGVSGLRQHAAGVDLRFAGGAVAADAVAGLVRDLACREAGAVWRRFLPRGSAALALWERQPVLVLAAGGVVPTPLAPAASTVARIEVPGKDSAA